MPILSREGALMNYPWLFCPSDNFEQRLALPTCWCASVHTLFYCYWLCDPRRCEINVKVRAPRRVSSATHCHLNKSNMDETSMHHPGETMLMRKLHQNIVLSITNIFFELYAYDWYLAQLHSMYNCTSRKLLIADCASNVPTTHIFLVCNECGGEW